MLIILKKSYYNRFKRLKKEYNQFIHFTNIRNIKGIAFSLEFIKNQITI